MTGYDTETMRVYMKAYYNTNKVELRKAHRAVYAADIEHKREQCRLRKRAQRSREKEMSNQAINVQ